MRTLLVGGPADIGRDLRGRLMPLDIIIEWHWEGRQSAGTFVKQPLPSGCEAVIILADHAAHGLTSYARELAKAEKVKWALTNHKRSILARDLLRAKILQPFSEADLRAAVGNQISDNDARRLTSEGSMVDFIVNYDRFLAERSDSPMVKAFLARAAQFDAVSPLRSIPTTVDPPASVPDTQLARGLIAREAAVQGIEQFPGMQVVTIGGHRHDVEHRITPILKEYGLTHFQHVETRHFDRNWHVPPKADIVVCFIDMASPGVARQAVEAAKKADVPCIVTARTTPAIETSFTRYGLAKQAQGAPSTAPEALPQPTRHVHWEAGERIAETTQALASEEVEAEVEAVEAPPEPTPEPEEVEPTPTPAPAPAPPALSARAQAVVDRIIERERLIDELLILAAALIKDDFERIEITSAGIRAKAREELIPLI